MQLLVCHADFRPAICLRCPSRSVVKPAAALVALFLSLFGLYEDGNFNPAQSWVWLTLIINASVAVAFYSLVRVASQCSILSARSLIIAIHSYTLM